MAQAQAQATTAKQGKLKEAPAPPPPHVVLPYVEGDELFTQIMAQAIAYEKGKADRDTGEEGRKVAQAKLSELMARAASTEKLKLELVDGIECGPEDAMGKRYVFQVTRSKRRSVNVQKLLEAGIPAAVIEACTDVNEVEAWAVAFKKG